MAPEVRPDGSLGAVGAVVGAPGAVVDAPVAVVGTPPPWLLVVELEAELEVCVGMPVVGNVRGVDFSEEDDSGVEVGFAGTSEAWKLSW